MLNIFNISNKWFQIFKKKLDQKVNKTMDERLSRAQSENERLRREMKIGFESIQESLVALQNLLEGKIKLAEDRLEKEIEKIRKMVVLI